MEFFSVGENHIGVRFEDGDSETQRARVSRELVTRSIDATLEQGVLHFILDDDCTADHALALAERAATFKASRLDPHDPASQLQRIESLVRDELPLVMTRFSPFVRH